MKAVREEEAAKIARMLNALPYSENGISEIPAV